MQILLALLIGVSLATKGFDLAGTSNAYSCLKADGHQFAIVRGYRSVGAIDTTAAANIEKAKAQGMYTDVYFFPCSHAKSAKDQVNEFYNGLSMEHKEVELISDEPEARGMQAGYYPGWQDDISDVDYQENEPSTEMPEWRKETLDKSYGMVWLDVEINPSSRCGWGTDYSKNCAFVEELVDELLGKGLNVGIYASNYMWQTVMGSQRACP